MESTIGTREEWLVARKELLEREKELTRLSDGLARRSKFTRIVMDLGDVEEINTVALGAASGLAPGIIGLLVD